VKSFSLANAKAHLSELVERVAAGESIAQLVSIQKPRKPIDIEALRALTDSMPKQKEPARKFIRRMRDDARY
jgi:antitoxin (DNA-binding transcriptional repressor) of toxin-antitoxin stability system